MKPGTTPTHPISNIIEEPIETRLADAQHQLKVMREIATALAMKVDGRLMHRCEHMNADHARERAVELGILEEQS